MKIIHNTIGTILTVIAMNAAQLKAEDTQLTEKSAGESPAVVTTLEDQARTVQAIAEEASKDFDPGTYAQELNRRIQIRLTEIPVRTQTEIKTPAIPSGVVQTGRVVASAPADRGQTNKASTTSASLTPADKPSAIYQARAETGKLSPRIENESKPSLGDLVTEIQAAVNRLKTKIDNLEKTGTAK
jgi:hypothetical protein